MDLQHAILTASLRWGRFDDGAGEVASINFSKDAICHCISDILTFDRGGVLCSGGKLGRDRAIAGFREIVSQYQRRHCLSPENSLNFDALRALLDGKISPLSDSSWVDMEEMLDHPQELQEFVAAARLAIGAAAPAPSAPGAAPVAPSGVGDVGVGGVGAPRRFRCLLRGSEAPAAPAAAAGAGVAAVAPATPPAAPAAAARAAGGRPKSYRGALTTARTALKQLRRKLARLEKKHHQVVTERDDALEALQAHEYFRQAKKNNKMGDPGRQRKRHILTVAGGLKIVCARNQGHGGGLAVLQHLGIDESLDNRTVYKWERVFASCIILLSRAWFNYHYTAVTTLQDNLNSGTWQLPDEQRLLTYELIQVVADATNTPAAQSSKAHVMQLKAVFGPPGAFDTVVEMIPFDDGEDIVNDDGEDGDAADAPTLLLREEYDYTGNDDGFDPPQSSIHKVYPDMRCIPNSGFGGKALRSMLIEQMQSVGCRSWTYEAEHETNHATEKHIHIRVQSSSSSRSLLDWEGYP